MSVTTGMVYGNSSNSDNFRSWVRFLYDGIVATGSWTRLAGLTRADLDYIAAPTAANEVKGYFVFGTGVSPNRYYLKIEVGGGSVGGLPAIWVTVGTGHDGTDGLTGASTRFQLACQSSSNDLRRCDVAGGAMWLTFAMFNDWDETSLVLCIEPLLNYSGTSDGLGYAIIGGTNLHAYHQVIPALNNVSVKVWPLQDAGASFPSFPALMPPRNITSAMNGLNFGVTTIHPWATVHYAAMRGAVAFFSGTDIPAGRCTFAVTRYGTSSTYLAPAAPFLIGDHNLAMAIRYE